ncbi:hypothetical protein [Chitinophaga arvensicola]|uniref:Uncharacterized protein n=1 Tax=Chitinophaga arvensicola TaxID=29529 RepID=A0A1I0SDY8_9BACT|nr:hypothetical protein [Chitinophaga arvensicola]SEW57474.1 hypothetical protein SAMN04488122_6801 [Chitinophaga arvensicola]
MPPITAFDTLDKEIIKVGGKPVVLEALWSGDTNGWYLLLYVNIIRSRFLIKREEQHLLGEVTLPEDSAYYTDGRPTVAMVAEELGKWAAQKYGLTFYFPSRDNADEDCPGWAERHLGVHCEDCNKLMLLRESSHLPREVCYSCYLNRKSNESLRNADPSDHGYNFCLSKNEEYIKEGYCTKFEDFTIAPFIQDKVKARLTSDIISTITLDQEDILVLKGQLETTLEGMLLAYEMPQIDERKRRFIGTYKMQYGGKEYVLMDRHNDAHTEIASYISNIKTAEKAIAEGYTYQFFFKQGITYRDDAFLRFINYVCKGETSLFAIHQKYARQLNTTDISTTLEKLEKIGCIVTKGEQVIITRLGYCIV